MAFFTCLLPVVSGGNYPRTFRRKAWAHRVIQRVVGRIEVETHDVPEFAFKIGIVRELESLDDVRFELALRPDPLHCAMGDAYMATHAAHAPALAALGRARDFGDDTLDLPGRNPRL